MSNTKYPFFTEEHEMFRQTVRAYVEKELAPHRQEWEKNKWVPIDVFRKLGEQGFFGIKYDQKYGGSGCDYWYNVVFAEEMVRCRMNGFVMDVLVHTDMTTPALNSLATEEQKQEFLVPAIKGEKIAALGVTEPGAGSDVAHIRTTAKKDGDHYIINGQKTYITNGTRADFILLATRTGPALTEENWNSAQKGISFFIFPTHDGQGNDTPGFSRGRKLDKMGNDSSDTRELFFEDCRVPAKNLLGQENHGFYYVMMNFQGERLIASLMGMAASELMIQDTLAYLRDRHAFGRRIIDFQVWKHKLAELSTEVEAAKALVYHACDLYNRGIPDIKIISMAKLFCTELSNKVAYACVQAHGGAGYMDEYDISRMYRDVRLITIGAGTSEVMKEIIAKELGYYDK